MNLTFLNGAFLFAALAALLPLLIHLISRRRVATVDFSSLRFLKELERKRIRRVRLRQILLLIIRSLIILCAALALARPTLKGAFGGGGSGHARTSVAIVIDDSASMSRSRDDGDLLTAALNSAGDIADLLDEGDQAFLVTAGSPATAVLSDGTFSSDALAEALGEVNGSSAATDYTSAVALASDLLAGSRNLNRELYVLGDMQSTGWSLPDRAIASIEPTQESSRPTADSQGGGPSVYVLPLSGPTSNMGIADVAVERRHGASAGVFSITAGLVNYGHRGGEALVRLVVDGVQAGQAGVEVTPGAAATARFTVTVDENSWHECRVELPPDALELDNTGYFVIPAARSTNVLLVRPDAEAPDDADYIERALDPTSEGERFALSVVRADALSRQEQGRFPVVLLADVGRLDASASTWLRSHAASGGGVLLVLGNRTDVRFWNAGLLRDISGVEIIAPIERSEGVRISPSSQGHPLLEGLAFGERLIDDIAVRRAYEIRAPASEEVLELPGISPALVVARPVTDGTAVGEVAVLATGIDQSWSDLPRSGFVVPLMHRIVERLSREGAAPAPAISGEDLVVALPNSPSGRVDVVTPGGSTLAAELRSSRAPAAIVRRAEEPGVYRFLEGGRTVAMGAVNVDPRESDVRALDRDEIADRLSPFPVTFIEPGEPLRDRVLQARHGRELWRLLLYVALALLAVEMLLARPRVA